MTRNQVVASVLAVVAVAVVVRVAAAALIVFPKPEDTAYYVGVARNLLDGRGLVSDALWSYQTTPLTVPRAAFEVWLPLPTFLAAIPMAVFGSTFAAAQVSSVVVGALVPVLAWRLAADTGAERGLPPGRVAVLALGAGLMSRLARSPRRATRPPRSRLGDPRLLVLGLLVGLAALTRNEAAWLGLAWAIVAWSIPGTTRAERVRLVAIPALIAVAVFVPWAIRDWVTFGSPLPGQAASNALSLNGRDIFAWSDPPTIQRYLAAGLPRLLELRLIGFAHNLFNVLVLLGMPISVIGLAALPWFGRGHAIRPGRASTGRSR